jgi:hypothetical protein
VLANPHYGGENSGSGFIIPRATLIINPATDLLHSPQSLIRARELATSNAGPQASLSHQAAPTKAPAINALPTTREFCEVANRADYTQSLCRKHTDFLYLSGDRRATWRTSLLP